MIEYFFILFSSLLIGNGDCNTFKYGTFHMNIGDGKVYKIIRTENKQIEEDADRGVKIEYDIKWDSQCSYKLYNFKAINGSEHLPQRNYDTLYCRITDIQNQSFRVLCHANGYPELKTPIIEKVQ